jgi:hypothetical protein
VALRSTSNENGVLCCVKTKVYGPFFLAEANVTDLAFPDMLERWFCPPVRKNFRGLYQDEVPPLFHTAVMDFLAEQL